MQQTDLTPILLVAIGVALAKIFDGVRQLWEQIQDVRLMGKIIKRFEQYDANSPIDGVEDTPPFFVKRIGHYEIRAVKEGKTIIIDGLESETIWDSQLNLSEHELKALHVALGEMIELLPREEAIEA